MEKYSFEQFWKDLNEGYQLYFDYMVQMLLFLLFSYYLLLMFLFYRTQQHLHLRYSLFDL